MLMTSAEFIELIKAQDGGGGKIISFGIYNADNHDEMVASGEIDNAQVYLKFAQQTDEGDKDIVRVDLYLDCNV